MAPKVLDQTLKDVQNRLRLAKETGQKIITDDPARHTEYFPMRIERKELPEERTVQFTTRVVVGRGLWFWTMKHLLTSTLKILPKHKWSILEAPNGLPWFTSDDPAICLNFRSESDYDLGGGWNRTAGNILFPLSSRHLMFTEIGADFYPGEFPLATTRGYSER